MDGLVVSVAAFAEDEEVRAAILRSDRIRASTLSRCYAIPGYDDLPLEEKNTVYDRIRKEVEQSEDTVF